MPTESIEALRLITNLETESRKLLQVVLFGQPELDHKLAQPELRQLKQRITFSYTLRLMDADQVFQYVRHRMTVAGYRGSELFSKGLCRQLFRASKGTPRIVNVLCHKALMLAYGEGKQHVESKHIKLAIRDTEAATPASWLTPATAGLFCLTLAIAAAAYLALTGVAL